MLLSLLFTFFFTVAFAGNPQKLITVYGVANGSQLLGSRFGNVNYQLQLGAFKHEANAIQCKNYFRKKTTFAIQIVPPKKSNGLYSVVLGPLKNSMAVRAISNQFLSNKSISHPKIAKKHSKKSALLHKVENQNSSSHSGNERNEGEIASVPVANNDEEEIVLEPVLELKEEDLTPAEPVNGIKKDDLTQETPEIPPQTTLANAPANDSLTTSQEAADLQAKEIINALKISNYDSDDLKLAIDDLHFKQITNDLQLKAASDPEEIAMLKKRQTEINQELEKKVTLVIEHIQEASR